MLGTLRASWKPILRGGAVALSLGAALGACRVSTDLADATHDGAGGDDGASHETGGAQSLGSGGDDTPSTGGTSSDVGGTGGTSSEVGGTGGTGSEVGGTGGSGAGGETGGSSGATSPGGGVGGDCWDPTVQNYCATFGCPVSAQAPSWPSEEELRQHFKDSGACDEHTVMMDRDLCGGVMIGYDDGTTADLYLSISGTLGATANTREVPFGPCNQTHYYAGIEHDEWYSMCEIESRCVVCGPPLPDEPGYPSCRFDCGDCELVERDPEPCADPDSCGCYCERISTHAG